MKIRVIISDDKWLEKKVPFFYESTNGIFDAIWDMSILPQKGETLNWEDLLPENLEIPIEEKHQMMMRSNNSIIVNTFWNRDKQNDKEIEKTFVYNIVISSERQKKEESELKSIYTILPHDAFKKVKYLINWDLNSVPNKGNTIYSTNFLNSDQLMDAALWWIDYYIDKKHGNFNDELEELINKIQNNCDWYKFKNIAYNKRKATWNEAILFKNEFPNLLEYICEVVAIMIKDLEIIERKSYVNNVIWKRGSLNEIIIIIENKQ